MYFISFTPRIFLTGIFVYPYRSGMGMKLGWAMYVYKRKQEPEELYSMRLCGYRKGG